MRRLSDRLMLAILVGAMVVIPCVKSTAAVPPLVNYQGILTNGSGTPQVGTFSVSFALYDVPLGGAALWTETQNGVTTNSGGMFNVLLGIVTPLSDIVFSGADRYLGTTVSPDPEMMPRTRITTVANAFRVATVDGASGGNITSKVSIGSGHTNTGSDVFVAGANNTVTGMRATVPGGLENTASGRNAVVSGGQSNTASGDNSLICGGISNHATAVETVVGGGSGNLASGTGSVISGGAGNEASGLMAKIGGGFYNRARGDFSTIGGGGGPGGPDSNLATGNSSTVAGGRRDFALGNVASVGGGESNSALGYGATIAGGGGNRAEGNYATVPGGLFNTALGANSFAAGRKAKAVNDGEFVWSDNTDLDFPAVGESNFFPAANNFLVRATGGVVFVSGVDGTGISTAGVSLAPGSGSWSVLSDHDAKEQFAPVDGLALLRRLASIPIGTWNYKAQDRSIRHIGPMAQDFHSAFGIGEDDKHITTVDADGVALAAIQALYKRNQELESAVEKLQARIEQIEANAAANPK